MMINKLMFAVVFLSICSFVQANEDCRRYHMQTSESGWCIPVIKLEGKLKELFTVSNCKYISGLSCKFNFNENQPPPNSIFYSQFDSKGNFLNKKKLIYPYLNKGKSGIGTISIHESTTTLVFEGKWSE